MDDIRDANCMIFPPSKISPRNGDIVIMSPVYVFQSQVFEQRILSPSKYFRRIVIVDACDGRAELTDFTFIPFSGNPWESSSLLKLKSKISVQTAEILAKYAVLPYENGHYGRKLKNWMIFISAKDVKQMWRIYIIRNSTFIDTCTSASVSSNRIGAMADKFKFLV